MNLKNILSFLFLSLFLSNMYAQSQSEWKFDCDLGFEYAISNNKNWGIHEPVVTYVEPGSPAQFAGLKVNDIIMQVRCDATYLRDSILIDRWLRDESDVLTNQITIRNLDNYFTEYLFNKTCGTIGRLSEIKLASMFEAYSLDNSRKEIFTMPIQVAPMDIEEHDYSDYHTFDFDASYNNISPDLQVYIENVLAGMGILRNNLDPDFLIRFNFLITDKDNAKQLVSTFKSDTCGVDKVRYNVDKQTMDRFTIADVGSTDFEQQASISFEFVEKKNIDTTKFTPIWKANIIENFTEKVDVNHYLNTYIPLILMQFPFTSARDYVTFQADIKQYLYTGIEYDSSDMQKIAELDPYGPAYQAGIFLGYKILKIQDIDLAPSLEMIKQNYNIFIKDTQAYRSKACYHPSSANTYNYFWDKKNMNIIQKFFEPKRSNQVFAYLFDFIEYINPKYDGKLKFEVTNGTNKRTVYVKPEVRTLNSLRVIQ